MRQVNKLDNKLNNLSRPVAWIIGEKEIEEFKRGYETFVVRGDDVEGSEPTMELYSKECVSALMADNEYMRWRIKEMDLLFGKNLLAMRAAVIEAEHGEGHTAGMQWIFNTLFGPGEFAPANETDAQGYFNREAEKIDVEFSKCMAFFTAHHEEKKGHVGDATDKVDPAMICDTCGHDADHQGNRTYKCDNDHVFQMRSEPVSQGYKLVPVEPTPKQWAAGVKAMDTGMDKVTLVYKAMLATAPTQGENQ